MLWIVGTIFLAIWLIAKFVFGKTGLVHTILFAAFACFVIQFLQDRRTKAYYREQNEQDS